MNRNTESHFSQNPTIGISRSKFDRSFTHKTTFDTGELIPIFCDTTIMPGDTVKMRTSEVIRMATPICPVMDNAFADLYFFFVPYRLIWDHFKRFMGENDTAPWTQTTEYTIPQVKNNSNSNANQFAAKSLADYFGYPVGISKNYTASALPFRAYSLVWNEFFRDENLQNPAKVYNDIDATADTISYNYPNYDYVNHTAKGGGYPLKVCKPHDYFTSCLPEPQKGPSVAVPLGESAPILFGEPESSNFYSTSVENTNLTGKKVNLMGKSTGQGYTDTYIFGKRTDSTTMDYALGYTATNNPQLQSASLYADLSQAVGATVNQLRQAFAVQKFYEKQALGGTRYIEMVKAHFDVTNPDFRLQRPEYLGGKQIPINMNQVIQSTPAASGTTPLGATGAYSVTSDRDEMFTHSFTEHGILLGLCCVRTTHTYQQGLNRQYSKKKFTDFYFPVFANLGNQAVLNKEIYLQGENPGGGQDSDIDEQAFGYQEAWATERYFPDIVTGEMRSNYSTSLDVWHYADSYSALPSLGDTWIQETKNNVNRTLAVQNHSQFIADFYFGAIYTRPMPLYSIPGLIDHH